jgi:ribosomal protein L11 methyltransferase
MVVPMQRDAAVEIAPYFHVVPPDALRRDDGVSIVLKSGAAFGDGKHETTQLCLQAVAAFAPRPVRPWSLLDFGSGTGILSIAAARLGATAHGVEIDEASTALAEENVHLNALDGSITFTRSLPGATFDVVVANILRGVLVAAADDLVAHLAASGTLVLSGLVWTDVPAVSAVYAKRLGGRRPEIYERGEWRALAWRGNRELTRSSA